MNKTKSISVGDYVEIINSAGKKGYVDIISDCGRYVRVEKRHKRKIWKETHSVNDLKVIGKRGT